MENFVVWLVLLVCVSASSIEDPEIWNNLQENDCIPPSLQELFLLNKPEIDVDRIVGGQIAPPNSYPHQVGLGLSKYSGGSWCGGSIISRSFIVTAAHCLEKDVMYATIIMGAHDRQNPSEPGRVTVTVSRSSFIVHSGWNMQRMIHDIALIRLSTPITFTDKIKAIALPSQSASTFEGLTATISGWGNYETTTLSRYLRHTQTPVVNNNICQMYFGQMVHPSNICLDGSQGRGTCHGDSGGPLIVNTAEKGLVLAGLTSYGNPNSCLARWPTAFTRISSYLSWISINTGIAIN